MCLIILVTHVAWAVSDVESGDASDSDSDSDESDSDSDSCCGYDGPNRDAGNLNQ